MYRSDLSTITVSKIYFTIWNCTVCLVQLSVLIIVVRVGQVDSPGVGAFGPKALEPTF